jgi:RNA polymerase sigma-70 factor (ECF subfamily)
MADAESFQEMLLRLERGENDAAAQVFQRFAARLVALAGGRLNQRLLQKVDPEDVVQSAFRSFFCGQRAGKFKTGDWGGLWGLLVTITLRKCGRRAEEFYAARRDVRREGQVWVDESGSRVEFEIAAPDPSPSEAAALAELLEQVAEGLDVRAQEIFALRLEGYTVPEISARIGRTERTVHRILGRVRKQLERERN